MAIRRFDVTVRVEVDDPKAAIEPQLDEVDIENEEKNVRTAIALAAQALNHWRETEWTPVVKEVFD